MCACVCVHTYTCSCTRVCKKSVEVLDGMSRKDLTEKTHESKDQKCEELAVLSPGEECYKQREFEGNIKNRIYAYYLCISLTLALEAKQEAGFLLIYCYS